jgi:Zn-dependent protease with chaperone function
MLYVLFLILAIAYNLKKFRRERAAFLSSILDAKTSSHREMILSHHFYIFIFEGFLAFIVAHLITEKAMLIGIIELAIVYLFLLFLGFFLYQFFIRYVERHTNLVLYQSFKIHLIKELRVNFSVIMLPILVYAVINWALLDSVYEEWGSLWFIGLLFNIIFVSILTIACSVIIMLRLIPNREITEPEYLDIINRRLSQIKQPNIRVKWIESDIKNAFVVGLKLLKFSNQTMFIGRSLRSTLTLEEFDAVIAHELAHVANRHIHKRVIDLMKNFISVILGTGFIMLLVLGLSMIYWGEDAVLYSNMTSLSVVLLVLGWWIFNYCLLFDTIRSHEFESDGFAVIELGASFEALSSALQKLTSSEELPEYLKARRKQPDRKGFFSWVRKIFSTHPDLDARIWNLRNKIDNNLPFNYYVSTFQKMKQNMAILLNWKVSVPLTGVFVYFLVWGTISYRTGEKNIAYIESAPVEEIIRAAGLASKINSRPLLVGKSLLFYVVQRKDERLIDHFLEQGADKGRALVYISQLRDLRLLEKYYDQYQDQLTEEEYFLVLRKTAQLNFTEGHRHLVNARRFESLHPDYKENLSTIYESKKRMPASDEK